MHPEYHRLMLLEYDRPELNPMDHNNLILDIAFGDAYDGATTDSDASTRDHVDACFLSEILELLTWAGNTVKTSLLSSFPFLE